jgi:lipopolysaccharide/colanic/teichoic acid biosynthesis glycosyltransferase
MAVLAALIRLDSKGPAIFRQERVGENGRVFLMFKFRTMTAGAEVLEQNFKNEMDLTAINHKQRFDPRVTRIGRFLRRYSLDELPQLYNVLRGDMSLVGPRPELPWLVAKYDSPQRRRLAVPQGMTGWWQVTGRSNGPMHLNTDQDLHYVYHYSLWLDVQILAKTLKVVLRGEGAF